MRVNFQKQDNRGVLWDPGAYEISYNPCIDYGQASGFRGPPFDPGRRFQLVRDHDRSQVHGDSIFNWQRFWYAVALVPAMGVK